MPWRDVLVAHREALHPCPLELGEELVARVGPEAGRPFELAAPVGVRLPELARLPRKQRARAGTDVEGQRATKAQRERLDAQALEPLDAHRVIAAPHEQEHGLARRLVDPLHHRQRGLALVEALDHCGAEAHQLPAEAEGPWLGARLDEVECFEARRAAGRPWCGARSATRPVAGASPRALRQAVPGRGRLWPRPGSGFRGQAPCARPSPGPPALRDRSLHSAS